MTAVALFDALSSNDRERQQFLARFASHMIAGLLADLERLAGYEREFASTPRSRPEQELEVRRSVWALYSVWAEEADEVLSRARALSGRGVAVDGVDRLDEAVGRVLARLSVPPEQTARAVDDTRQGRAVPAKELRDELHGRLRA